MCLLHVPELPNLHRWPHMHKLRAGIFSQHFHFTYILNQIKRIPSAFLATNFPTVPAVWRPKWPVWRVNKVFITIFQLVNIFLFLDNNYCVSCTIFKCLTCDDGPVCTSCDTNYILDFENLNKTCQPCPYDEYSLSNACYKCSGPDINCISCYNMTSTINCTLCVKDWIPDPSTWQCVLCITIVPNCITCSDTENCTFCKFPYLVGPTMKCDLC